MMFGLARGCFSRSTCHWWGWRDECSTLYHLCARRNVSNINRTLCKQVSLEGFKRSENEYSRRFISLSTTHDLDKHPIYLDLNKTPIINSFPPPKAFHLWWDSGEIQAHQKLNTKPTLAEPAQ